MATTERLLTNGRRKRKREWVKPFLRQLRKTGCIRTAVDKLNGMVTEWNVYKARASSPTFKLACDAAIESKLDDAVGAAFRRGIDGWDNIVMYQGQPCYVWLDENNMQVPQGTPGARPIPILEKKYSEALLLEILRKRHKDFKEVPTQGPVINVQNNNLTIPKEFLERVNAYRAAIDGLAHGRDGQSLDSPQANAQTNGVHAGPRA